MKRHAHSCDTALARLTDSWLSVINRSDLFLFCFYLKKAFDLVDHRILLSNLSVYLNSSNSVPFFSVHTLKVEYYVSLSVAPTRLKELFNMVYQKGQSWDLYSSVSILIIYLCIRSAECHMLADDTTLHTTGKSIVQIQKTLQLCLDRISVWCNTNHMLINPVKVCNNYYTTKAPALRLVIEAVIGWSEY